MPVGSFPSYTPSPAGSMPGEGRGIPPRAMSSHVAERPNDHQASSAPSTYAWPKPPWLGPEVTTRLYSIALFPSWTGRAATSSKTSAWFGGGSYTPKSLIGLGQLKHAAAAVADLEQVASARHLASIEVDSCRLRGSLEDVMGNDAAARTAFNQGLAALDGIVMPFSQALLEAAFGRFLLRSHDRRAAIDHLRTAKELLRGLDARPYLAFCEEELSNCGLPRARKTRETTFQLTPKERAVAHLAVEGMTNREIGTSSTSAPSPSSTTCATSSPNSGSPRDASSGRPSPVRTCDRGSRGGACQLGVWVMVGTAARRRRRAPYTIQARVNSSLKVMMR